MFKSPCANRKYIYILPAILIIISIISMIFRGFNYGIDFTSGTTFEFTLPEGYSYSADMEEEIRELVSDTADGASTQIQQIGTDGMFIKMTELDNDTTDAVVEALLTYFGGEVSEDVLDSEVEIEAELVTEEETAAAVVEEVTEEAVEEATEEVTEEEEIIITNLEDVSAAEAENLTEAEEEPVEEETVDTTVLTRSGIKIDKVSASVSAQLIGNTFKAVLLAVILMLIYIGIRFDFKSGVCAVAALAHDLIIMFGFYSLFQCTMNTSFVAAVLTIIGYSINATIIVFDRVRENVKSMRKASFDEKADAAIRSSYTRTLFSSLTTLFTIGALYILGVSSIREFALPIIVGLVCGAYSSLFVAPTLWGLWKESGAKTAKAKNIKK
ncbi:MAG: protein translocase subunit SecF [Clostridia bacterium]|nr:protein translocase subunit SecF [Clostridia bacterium]